MVGLIKGTLYTCECGYETLSSDRASKHSKTLKCTGNSMKKRDMRFVSEEDYMANTGHAANNIMCGKAEQNEYTIAELREENKELSATVKRQKNAIMKLTDSSQIDDDDDCERSGLIYFVRDAVVIDRGKIGRTKNTDVKKLKSRYSTFGDPLIQCYFSMDIKTDESKLKARLREINCMRSNAELVTNCPLAIRVFCEFASGS